MGEEEGEVAVGEEAGDAFEGVGGEGGRMEGASGACFGDDGAAGDDGDVQAELGEDGFGFGVATACGEADDEACLVCAVECVAVFG